MKNEQDYSKEIEFIKEWCIAVINFLSALRPSNEVLKEFQPMKEALSEKYTVSNAKVLKGLKGFLALSMIGRTNYPMKNTRT